MSEVEEIRALLAKCSVEQQREIFQHLRETIQIHPFEAAINANKAEVILEALARAPDLTIRGIRGIVGEATFAVEVASRTERLEGRYACGKPLLRHGACGFCRNGSRAGENAAPEEFPTIASRWRR